MKNINTKKKSYRVLFFLISWILSSQFVQAQWVQTNGPYGGIINAITTGSNGDGTTKIFAGTSGSGVFLSTNNGTNWTSANEGLPINYIYSLTFLGTNLFASTQGAGVFLSTNNGNNWTPINSGLTSKNIWPLAVSGSNLFAGTTDSGVFLSTNNGESWTKVDSGLTNLDVRSLAVSGTNIFAGTENGLFLSSNNGTSWTPINSGLTNTFVFTLAISSNDKGGTNIFAGTYDGVFLSTNNGTSWVNAGLSNEWVGCIAVSGTNIFAGTNGDGVFLSTNNGTSWVQVNTGMTNVVMSLCVSGENIFAGTDGAGVFLSTNNGTSWTQVSSGIKNVGVKSFTISSNELGESNIFACSWGCIFRSTDNGSNWDLVNGNLGTMIYSLATNESNIFAGLWGDGVIRSTDNGTSWAPANFGLPRYVTSLIVSGTNLYAGDAGDNANDAGVFLSTNNGTSWAEVSSGLPASAMIWYLAASEMNLFAGTLSDGVFRSTNGTSWTPVNQGLTSSISSLVVSDKNLFVCASGNIYSSTDNGANWTNTGFSGNNLFVYGTYLFAASNNSIFLSANNGKSWTDISKGLPSNYNINSIIISNSNIFVCTGQNGNVWKRPLSEMIASIWQDSIKIKDNGNTSQSLKFGQSPSATDGIDASLGEAPLPPAPFGFDARFHLPAGDESWTDYRSSSKDTINWVMKFQPGSGGYPITFSWDKTALPNGSFYLKDLITGSIVNVNMKTSSSYTLSNTGINSLKITTVNYTHAKGDVNLDGSITAADATPILQYVVGLITLTPEQIYCADVNSDGTVAANDAARILYWAVNGTFPLWKTASASGSIAFGEFTNTSGIFTLPINLTNTKGINSIYAEITLGNQIEYKDIKSSLPEGWMISSNFVNGVLKIAMAGTKQLTDGSVALISFAQKGKDISLSINGNAVMNDNVKVLMNSVKINVIPTEYSLSQNYPNPFNPSTVISYGLPGPANVKINIYDVLGQLVESLVNGTQNAGYHEVRWNASSKSSGMYLYSIEAVSEDGKTNFHSVKKLLLLK